MMYRSKFTQMLVDVNEVLIRNLNLLPQETLHTWAGEGRASTSC